MFHLQSIEGKGMITCFASYLNNVCEIFLFPLVIVLLDWNMSYVLIAFNGISHSWLILTCFIFFFQNMEAEKQVKFFQGCVAAAFAERDHSIMEVVKNHLQSSFVRWLDLFLLCVNFCKWFPACNNYKVLKFIDSWWQAEKAKEKEEVMSLKFNEIQKRYLSCLTSLRVNAYYIVLDDLKA